MNTQMEVQKQRVFAVRCKNTLLFISNFTPCRAALEVTPVERIATTFKFRSDAKKLADSLRPLFGSYEFEPVAVEV